MAAAFILAKKNGKSNFKEAITSQEDGVEQNYRTDKFQKVTSFRLSRAREPNLYSAENDKHAGGCEKSAVKNASS